MRVSADSDLIELKPGGTAEVGLEVVNTGQVIDGITARVVGLPDRQVSTRPAVLPLFPDSSGRMTLIVGVPPAFPAGLHPVTVEIRSRQPETVPSYLDLDLRVPTAPAMELASRPEVIRSHRAARFVVTVNNGGNIGLDVGLTATDPERAVACRIEPAAITVPAGGAVEVVVTVRGPRMLLGTELDRPINLTATGRPLAPGRVSGGTVGPIVIPVGPPDAGDDSGTGDEQPAAELLTASKPLTLRQRPWLTRGLLTGLILLAIVGLWAAIFLFGLGQVFGKDPLTKSAPASFFATPPVGLAAQQGPVGSDPVQSAAGTGRGATGTGTGGAVARQGVSAAAAPAAAENAAQAPAGALPKDGSLPAGTAGVVGGTITAKSDGSGIGRILVEAVRRTGSGELKVSSSAASQTDGSYEIAGLFPGNYLLRFSADGFIPVYYPGTTNAAKARPVPITMGEVAGGTDMVLSGKPATISGTVDPGDTLDKTVTTVTARMVGGAAGAATVTTRTDAVGRYRLAKLASPATYELVFSTKGYQPSTVRATVEGGARRIQPTVVLSAGDGQIAGLVTDGSKGIGQATVTTTVKGVDVKSGTPTTGTVGAFVLGDLPTPATYVLTVTADGYATTSVVADLKPGQKLTGLTIALVKGSGQVSGRLVDSTGAGLGGATVTVGGGADLPGTTTLTAGTVGGFSLDKLPNPGSYTLTFSLAGYADQTVPLTLDGAKPVAPLTVTMTSSMGRITGRVLSAGGGPVAGATVVATDGVRTWPVTSTASTGVVPAGGYVITGLAAGTYTVTATGQDALPHTALVTVPAGGSATQDFTLAGGG